MRIKLPNGQYGNFPDDMPIEQIEAVLQKQFGFQEPQAEESFLGKLPRNITAGVAQLGHGLINTPHNVAGLFSEELASHIPYQQEHDYSQEISNIFRQNKRPDTLADKLVQGLAQYAPAMALPGANLGKAGEAIGAIPKVGGFLGEAASQAVPQAAFAATQNENPMAGAAEGAIGAGIGTAIGRGLNAIRPSKLFRGELSPEELAHNLEISKGTETGLGRLVESPTLMRVQENILPNVIGSGAEKTMQRNAKLIQDKGQDILNKVHGNIEPEDYGYQLQNALKEATNQATSQKNEMYGQLNKIANEHKLNIGREHFQKEASEILNDIEQSPELKEEFGKDLYNDIKRYSKNPVGNNLKLSNIFRSKLGDKSSDLYINGKKYESSLLDKLKNALSNDIDSAFENSGNPKLKQTYNEAQKNYQQNFKPFEDKDLLKFSRRGGDPDLILSHFLKMGGNDRSNLLLKISKAVSPQNNEKGNILAASYLSKALDESGELNPVKFKALYNKLGKNQRKVLFGDMHKEIKNYADLVHKNNEAFNLMYNPKTGARNTELITKIGQLSAGSVLGIPGLETLVGGGLAARTANKLLTSEKLREKIIKAMIENKEHKIAPLPKIGGAIGGYHANEHKPLELELVGGNRR